MRKRNYRKRAAYSSSAYAFRLTTHPDEAQAKDLLDTWLESRASNQHSRSACLADIVVALIQAYQGEKPPGLSAEEAVDRRLDRIEALIRESQNALLEAIVANPPAAFELHARASAGGRLDDDFLENLMADFERT